MLRLTQARIEIAVACIPQTVVDRFSAVCSAAYSNI